ncbi:MAG: hypothetical protein Q4F13_03235 [Pseudomonadota bacterium]|nr:hypothetical protein [Pseudomonadota bacterium]
MSPTEKQPTVNLADHDKSRLSKHLPHEKSQQPNSQSPAAGQDDTPEAHAAYRDAQKGRPDTSAAPQLQRPSPEDAKR